MTDKMDTMMVIIDLQIICATLSRGNLRIDDGMKMYNDVTKTNERVRQ